jgi:hypothetical protein
MAFRTVARQCPRCKRLVDKRRTGSARRNRLEAEAPQEWGMRITRGGREEIESCVSQADAEGRASIYNGMDPGYQAVPIHRPLVPWVTVARTPERI